MKSSTLKFFAAVALLTTICVALQFVWNNRMPEKMQLNHGFALLAVFPIATAGIHLFLLSSSKGSSPAFIRNYMASTVIKFFLYLSVLIGFLLYTPGNKQALIIHFLLYYVAFTALEVGMLYGELGKKE